MSVGDNYRAVADGVHSACIKVGRNPDEVKLIAVTKFVDTERIGEAIAAGAHSVGENRVQELRNKLDYFNNNQLDIHLIGQLQINKVKYIIGKVSLIQSLDRGELAAEISRLGKIHNVEQDVLVEVNIGVEAQKGGVAVDRLIPFLELVSGMPNIKVKGLMCVPPAVGEAEARAYFAKMRRLFEDIRGKNIPNVDMRELSMGMSGDYKSAVMEQATMVRVGRAIFGERPGAAARA